MTPEIRDNFSRAIEIGRWADGSKLSDEQRAICMRAVITWDANYAEETDEPFKVQKGGKLITSISKPKNISVSTGELIKSTTIEN